MSVQAPRLGFTADAVPGRPILYPRGKVTGGSSAVNATVALRGVPADYDEWAAWGNDEWSWQNVLPYFRKLEDDQDEHGDLHGTGGPIPIRRWKPAELRPVQQAYFDICRRLGFPRSPTTTIPSRPAWASSRRTNATSCVCRPRSGTSPRRGIA